MQQINEKRNHSLIDAITVTYFGLTVDGLICDLLHLGYLCWRNLSYGRYGYKTITAFGAITILSDGEPGMGICLELLGQGCREIEQLCGGRDIFHDLLTTNLAQAIRLRRIDIAIDDFQQILDMRIIEKKVDNGEVSTKLRKKTTYKGLDDTTGHTVGIGSRDNFYLRIYDKSAEQKTDYPWIRTELEIRKDAAIEFQRLICEQIDSTKPDKDAIIIKLGVRVIAGKVRFIEKTDTNISRCPTCSWWEQLLGGAEPITLSIPQNFPLGMEQAYEWIKKQIAPTLVLLMAYIGPTVIESIIHDGLNKIDIEKAHKWAQELYAIGYSLACNTEIDGTIDNDAIERILHKLLGDYFGSISKVSS